MRLYFVLTVVAVLTALVSASDAASASCPVFCLYDSTCDECRGGFCVSISIVCPGINHMTHRRDRASLYASSVAMRHVHAFASAQYG
ncbi:hypothetical protein EV702DRAFT_490895 [Suillus placidus]|uniref:Uncharacterized protein n=1 Tax=Suillus placidus TaxID=48579 RepID=A0A9P7A3P4_9AGAM|nr:hypothetical protein EV702DRAFT_490895 [Suillus placidus]